MLASLPSLFGLVLLIGLRPIDHLWVAAIALGALAFTLPGVLLLRALGVSAQSLQRFPLYVPAAAIFVISFSGLLADLVGPRIGIGKPLHGDTTQLTTVGVCLGLWICGLRKQENARLAWTRFFTVPTHLVPLALPLLSAAGAQILTNGHGGVLAAVAGVGAPVALFVGIAVSGRLTRSQMAMLLFGCALAMEWAFSIRSQEIIGYDISTELGIAERVHAAGIWHARNVGSPYGAMLSLTVLPSTLASISGISPLIAFKVVYPILAALLPVAVFLAADRIMRRTFAAAAASLIVVQYYFFEQLAELARQEVGLLFFVSLLATFWDADAPIGVRRRLVAVSAVGMVVSHYSTTYVAIAFVALSLPLYLIATRFRWKADLPQLLALVLVVAAGGAAVYYGPVTHSAGALTSFAKTLKQDGFDLFPESSGNVVTSYLKENTGYAANGATYERLAVNSYRSRSAYIHPLPQASERRYTLKSATVSYPPVRLTAINRLFSAFQPLFNELLLAFAGIGSLLALFGKTRVRRVLGVFGLAEIVLLILFRFSSTLASFYNETRALLQGLLILALPAGLLGQSVAQRLPRAVKGWVVPGCLGAAMGLMLACQDGATWLVVRGNQPLNLAQGGEAFERFYETPAELSAAQWVSVESRGRLLYADEYGGLRVAATSGILPLAAVTPKTIDQRAWVYGTHTNVVLGHARGDLDGYYAIYQWPNAFLNAYFDTVFDDGDSKVYHR